MARTVFCLRGKEVNITAIRGGYFHYILTSGVKNLWGNLSRRLIFIHLGCLLGGVETFDEHEHLSFVMSYMQICIYLLGIKRNPEKNIHCTQNPGVRRTTFMIPVEIIEQF